MNAMFQNTNAFNQPLNNWNVDKVIDYRNFMNTTTGTEYIEPNWYNINNNLEFTSLNIVNVNENQLNALTLTATDSNNGTLYYDISGGDANDFSINTTTGVITFNLNPDYEVKSTYTFTASVTEGINSVTQGITINLNDIDENTTEALTEQKLRDLIENYKISKGSNNTQDIAYYEEQIINANTSNITDMSRLFQGFLDFNLDISKWDTSNVTNMNYMFYSGEFIVTTMQFNQPLNDWDTSSVTQMIGMFMSTKAFNQPLNNWDTSSVTNMSSMFYVATAFNQPLNDWDTSNVTNMNYMFRVATAFNQPLNDWDTSSVTDMSSMFEYTESFNQPLNDWDTSSVTDMNSMFEDTESFNQPLNDWDTSSVTDMSSMFSYATAFKNQNLSSWNIEMINDHGWFMISSGIGNREPNWNW
jgi:surface protein